MTHLQCYVMISVECLDDVYHCDGDDELIVIFGCAQNLAEKSTNNDCWRPWLRSSRFPRQLMLLIVQYQIIPQRGKQTPSQCQVWRLDPRHSRLSQVHRQFDLRRTARSWCSPNAQSWVDRLCTWGFPWMEVSKMLGLQWTIKKKWMIWRDPYFR